MQFADRAGDGERWVEARASDMRVHVAAHCKARTVTTYRSVLDRHILPALGGMALSAVGRREIGALHLRLRGRPQTANAAVRIVSSMFQRAEGWDLVPPGRNPCRRVRRYRQRSRERFLTPEEYRRLGHALSEAEVGGAVWPPAIAAIRLLMLTGCRHSEILSLRWDDVDRTAGELRRDTSGCRERWRRSAFSARVVWEGQHREVPPIPINPHCVRTRQREALPCSAQMRYM